MPDNPRIEDLRRRVLTDPASIAFAQLAEECRRAGDHQEAVDVCRTGLAIHPGYTSARVTLGRALIQLNRLDEAKLEFERVLKLVPDNLTAIRGLAQVHERQGLLADALVQYQAALSLAPNDPELELTVERLAREIDVSSVGQEPPGSREAGVSDTDERDKAVRTILALEHWLRAIHVVRADRRA